MRLLYQRCAPSVRGCEESYFGLLIESLTLSNYLFSDVAADNTCNEGEKVSGFKARRVFSMNSLKPNKYKYKNC